MPRTRRRTIVDRWIVGLHPLFEVISTKVKSLKLGNPGLQIGPTFMHKDIPTGSDRIRRGAVWFLGGCQVGFHVDFHLTGLHIEAWSGKERRVSVWVAGEYTEISLKRDLSLVLDTAGLTELARTDEVRNILTGKT